MWKCQHSGETEHRRVVRFRLVLGSMQQKSCVAEREAMRRLTHPRSKLKAMVCATILAAATSALAKDGEIRSCETKFGGQVVCGDLIIGITLEQYKADLNKRAEEIRAEEAEKHTQLQKLVELTERATSAEKDSLRTQIAALEAEKRALKRRAKALPTGSQICRPVMTGWCRSSPRPMRPCRHLRR